MGESHRCEWGECRRLLLAGRDDAFLAEMEGVGVQRPRALRAECEGRRKHRARLKGFLAPRRFYVCHAHEVLARVLRRWFQDKGLTSPLLVDTIPGVDN